MFSSGNITEKLRVARFNCKGETVVDLYAGKKFSKTCLLQSGHICMIGIWNKSVVIHDMLTTGIGYFTLPYLVHAGAAYVHACEWNPDAVGALQKNLNINKVSERCTIHQGDNRQVNDWLNWISVWHNTANTVTTFTVWNHNFIVFGWKAPALVCWLCISVLAPAVWHCWPSEPGPHTKLWGWLACCLSTAEKIHRGHFPHSS